jgi:hypothetical protein
VSRANPWRSTIKQVVITNRLSFVAGEDVQPTHMLLYLMAATFKGTIGSQLADEIRKARVCHIPIFLVRGSRLRCCNDCVAAICI